MKSRVVGTIFLLCLAWGYLWVPIKISLQTFPPFLFTSLRLLLGAMVLLFIQLCLKKSIMPKREELLRIFILSFLMCIGYYGLSTFGIQYVGSGLSAILVYIMPIIINVLAHYFLGEHLNRNKIIGLCFGGAGILVILAKQLLSLQLNMVFVGELMIIVSAFFWACATMYTKKVFAEYDKVKLTLWQLLLGGIMLFIISCFSENIFAIQWQNSEALFYLGYSSFIGTAFAFLLWNWVISQIEASLASISIMCVPLLGIFFGHLQLHEPLNLNIIIGAILICIGIVCCSLKVSNLKEKYVLQ